VKETEKYIVLVTILIGVLSIFAIALMTRGGITGYVTLNMAELTVAPNYDVLLGDKIIDVSNPIEQGDNFTFTVTITAPTEEFYVYKTAYYSKDGNAIPFKLESTAAQGSQWIKGSATATLELKKNDFPRGGYIYTYTCREYTRSEIDAAVTNPTYNKLINNYFNGRDKAQLCGFREFTDKIEHENWRATSFGTPGNNAPPEVGLNTKIIADPAGGTNNNIQITFNGPTTVAVDAPMNKKLDTPAPRPYSRFVVLLTC